LIIHDFGKLGHISGRKRVRPLLISTTQIVSNVYDDVVNCFGPANPVVVLR
jgi:hypothetical protein